MREFKLSQLIGFLLIGSIVIFGFGFEDCAECFEQPWVTFKFVSIGFFIIIATIVAKLHYFILEASMTDLESLPLLQAREASDGVPFAGEAIIKPLNNKLLTSPYTNTKCVYFHSIKELYVTSERSGKWQVIENTCFFVPFLLVDETGSIEVDLTNLDADFSSFPIKVRDKGMPDPRNSEVDSMPLLVKSPDPSIQKPLFSYEATSKIRMSEYALLPDMKVFAHGMISKRFGQPVLHEHEDARLIISQKTRDMYVQSFYQGNAFIYGTYFLIATGFTIGLSALQYLIHMKLTLLFSLLITAYISLLCSMFFSMYNRLVVLFERAKNTKADIEGELKRRADLIPNIARTADTYAHHEKAVLDLTTSLRAELKPVREYPSKEEPSTAVLTNFIERFPQIRADKNFQKLSEALVDAEERIVYSREFYNRSVRKYNTLVRQFPFSIIADLWSFPDLHYFSIERAM